MRKNTNYNLISTRATWDQKCLFLDDLLEEGCDVNVFIGLALHHINWREMKVIGDHMMQKKSLYDNRTTTDGGKVDA